MPTESTKLRISFLNLKVTNNGEWTGKGELYWDFLVDGEPTGGRSISNVLKVADGELIPLSATREVRKSNGESLSISGSISERDNLDKDDFAPFEDNYTVNDSWGRGTHSRTVRDGRLDVTVTYKIERV